MTERHLRTRMEGDARLVRDAHRGKDAPDWIVARIAGTLHGHTTYVQVRYRPRTDAEATKLDKDLVRGTLVHIAGWASTRLSDAGEGAPTLLHFVDLDLIEVLSVPKAKPESEAPAHRAAPPPPAPPRAASPPPPSNPPPPRPEPRGTPPAPPPPITAPPAPAAETPAQPVWQGRANDTWG